MKAKRKSEQEEENQPKITTDNRRAKGIGGGVGLHDRVPGSEVTVPACIGACKSATKAHPIAHHALPCPYDPVRKLTRGIPRRPTHIAFPQLSITKVGIIHTEWEKNNDNTAEVSPFLVSCC